MRKILCTLLCLVMVFGYVAVDALAAKLNCEDVDWGLTLMVDDLTPTGMVVVMDQSGGHFSGQLEYCKCLSLQVRKDNAWVDVPHNIVECDLDPNNVPENSRSRMVENWERSYGRLPLGHYRYIKTFTEFNEDHVGVGDEADFYVEFVIAEPHSCHSDDRDGICDVCLTIMPHTCKSHKGSSNCTICAKSVDVFRVVGNADWMGSWQPNSDAGLMTEGNTGIFEKTFYNVSPGDYELSITKNGRFDETSSNHGENYHFTLNEQKDISIVFYQKSDHVMLKLFDGDHSGYEWRWLDVDNPKTSDLDCGLPVALLLFCTMSLPLLLRKRKEML